MFFNLFADTKPTADIEYLASAIIRQAIISKFQTLFGRVPVAKDQEQPLAVTNTRVPDLLVESVDPTISRMLVASAVEHSPRLSGELTPPPNSTLLYTVLDTEPASVALDGVPEYREMDTAASDSVVAELSNLPGLTVADGMAYVSKELSAIEIGIYSDNQEFASEFQYRLEQVGGPQVQESDKQQVFEDLYKALPGGEKLKESDAHTKLLKVVGLTGSLPPEAQITNKTKAPGPEPVAQAETQTQE